MTATQSGTRKALHAYVSDDCHDHWHDYADDNGMSVSALLEALGPQLRSIVTQEVVTNGHRVDAARRKRRK